MPDRWLARELRRVELLSACLIGEVDTLPQLLQALASDIETDYPTMQRCTVRGKL